MKRKGLWIGIIIVVILGALATYAYYTGTTAVSANTEQTEEMQTATVRQGSITISATGAGSVIPAEEVSLSFANSGIITELLVQVGDKVQAEDILARLDDTDAQEALLTAQLQLAQAAMQTDAAATEVGISFDDISVEQAKISLEEAQATLDDLQNWLPDPDEIAQAEANLESAKASLNAALGSEAASSSNITIDSISLEQAERDLADAQGAYNTAFDPGREWEFGIPRMADALEAERNAAINAVQRAEDNLAVAQANLNATYSNTNRSSSASAQSNVLSAELALQAAQTGPTEDEILAAETAVRQADLSLQQALLTRESNQLSLEQTQMNVTAAEEALADTILTAPMDGTVLAVNGNMGETAVSDLIVLADLDQPLLEIFLDETDLDKVGVNYEVEVVFDALPDDVFTGQIIQVDPQLSDSNGVSVIRALVLLDENSFSKPQTLPVGLNATVEVIGGRATNALLVPVEAVRELSLGSYAVFVMENGAPKLRMVEVGLMDFTFAEITSGLQAGEVVTTGIVETGQ